MEEVYELLKEEHEERIKKEKLIQDFKEKTGENAYTKFCIWCNAFNNSFGKNNPELFGKFLKEENIELNFWQKKHIAEKYFNWIYEFDSVKNKWNIKRKIS